MRQLGLFRVESDRTWPRTVSLPSRSWMSETSDPQEQEAERFVELSARRSEEGLGHAGISAVPAGVRLHADSDAASAARCLSADAFSFGRDVWFGEGRFRPSTEAGQHLIAHELAHIALGHCRNATESCVTRQQSSETPAWSVETPMKPSHLLTAYVRRPFKDWGHAFLSLGPLGAPESQTEYYGFYPACNARYQPDTCKGKAAIGTPGVIVDDRGVDFTSSIHREISTVQYRLIRKFAEDARRNPPEYHLGGYNCVDFVIEAASRAGIELPQAGWFVSSTTEMHGSVCEEAESDPRASCPIP